MGVIAASLIAGILFGLGLSVSGMVDPVKVLGFLDFFGDWDPTLAVVMAGALALMIPASLLPGRMHRPLLAGEFKLPAKTAVDARLVGGAALFGAGWGLVGFCPGPAISSLAFGGASSAIFVAAMLVGMGIFRAIER